MAVESALRTVGIWLAETIRASAAVTALAPQLFRDIAFTAASSYPFVRIAFMAAQADTLGVGMVEIVANPLFQVEVVDKNTRYVTCDAAYALIHPLIHRQSSVAVPQTGGLIVSCRRVRPTQFALLDGDQNYRVSGGLYQLQVA